MFWGLVLLTLGAVLIIQAVFKIDLPIFRVLAAVTLIYLGMKLMFGSFGITWNGQFERVVTANSVRFSEGTFSPFDESGGLKDKDFSTAFGEATLDLRDLKSEALKDLSDSDQVIRVQTAFGETKVVTPAQMPLVLEYSSAFGSIKVRGEEINAFGNGVYRTPDFKVGEPALRLKANAAFAEIEIQ